MAESKAPIQQQIIKTKKILKKNMSTEVSASEMLSVSTDSTTDEDEERSETIQIGKDVASASVSIDRQEYLTAYRDLSFERTRVQLLNNMLHRRLAEYYKKHKCDHVLKPLEGATDLEEKYEQKLVAYEELKLKADREVADIKDKVSKVQIQYTERLQQATKMFDELQQLERSVGSGLIYSRKGKVMTDKTVERYLTLQRQKSEEASALSLRYIQAKNALNDLEAVVKNLETLGPGLYVYQYEQLSNENQTFTNKVEEREDELIKTRKKCTVHNQILAHVREKMDHNCEVIELAEIDLREAEIGFSRAREDLSNVKGHRNKLRWSLEEEKMKAGLLTRKDLMVDFQASIDEVKKLQIKKRNLELQLLRSSKQLRGVRKSIQMRRTSTLHHQSQFINNVK